MSLAVRRLAAGLLASACALAQLPPSEAVRQAELAFARQGAEQGIRAAFLAWLEPEAVVFTPRLTSVQAQYGPAPGDPGHLRWHPSANGVSASGDLAWSTGPWSYAVKAGAEPLVHGHFLTVWRRQADGSWRVAADIGVPHGPSTEPALAPVGTGARDAVPAAAEALASLRAAEAVLGAARQVRGGAALGAVLARDGQVYRPGRLPLAPGAALTALLAGEGPDGSWQPERVQVSAAGDLGWACGESGPDAAGRRASALRVWVREAGAWKVRFDVRLPHPVPKP